MKMAFVVILSMLTFPLLAQQEVKPIKLPELEKLISKDTDHLKVINFWASWCGPCVKEMPHFDALDKMRDVEVYFVSLDFPQDLEKAERLILKKGIQSTTYLLDEKNYDAYITSISSDWSGAIPATLFVDKNGKKVFYEKAFEKEELEEIVEKLTTK